MQAAGEDETALATQAGDVEDDGIPVIAGVTDRAWSRISYGTNYVSSGVKFLRSSETQVSLYCVFASAGSKHFCTTLLRSSTQREESELSGRGQPRASFIFLHSQSATQPSPVNQVGGRLKLRMCENSEATSQQSDASRVGPAAVKCAEWKTVIYDDSSSITLAWQRNSITNKSARLHPVNVYNDPCGLYAGIRSLGEQPRITHVTVGGLGPKTAWDCTQLPDTRTSRCVMPNISSSRVSLGPRNEPGSGSFPGRVTPGFSQERTVLNDAASGQRVFSGISRFPHLFIPALIHSHLILSSSAHNTSLLRAAQNLS
ncbi:hypothetical protein PR048_019137 [Dryococelus australis]|uniref:Uncharacterized protein n=1 Tax=Dryococelus australis TaxID=614101 RepID=A0ABQ9H2S2_9NEOP|nr:hypothetical protein PR048_019137 [Dryococelus australis]